ncbi:hypothetical protein SELMODRAFT_418879 [Selaginella moellendorffii]|uniref:Homologous-pairing protein 2 homolog n=1 Tax=Selaginella moellendorffii TaxID=88036 RepID=D8S737_SELML|nr:homologous-pairing protein 2 homolog [Selaginella moellendorffii]EFJ19544.1 hypothetical protein SELMODRAFT_418879 [Selaginella moellendorffii]|eukprot:XP_002979136.1 homologous-pairing protein 2 homolog [Selaginella moellendorffii]
MPATKGGDSAEAIILNFINEQNRPLNVQIVADTLQKHGIKKTAAQKILDSFAESGKISFKEYGKQKIYLAKQDQFEIPSKEELESMKADIAKLQESLAAEKKIVAGLETEVRSAESSLTLDQINDRMKMVSDEISSMESRITQLRAGTVLVTAEERNKVEADYNKKTGLWRKRKRMFKDLWDMITESMPKNQSELKEEVGIETDDDLGIDISKYCSYKFKKAKLR